VRTGTAWGEGRGARGFGRVPRTQRQKVEEARKVRGRRKEKGRGKKLGEKEREREKRAPIIPDLWNAVHCSRGTDFEAVDIFRGHIRNARFEIRSEL